MRKALRLLPVLVAIVAAFFLGYSRHETKAAEVRRIIYYQDPMHPAYRSDKPGTAPDCGMDLVPVYSDGVAKSLAPNDMEAAGTVEIDPATLSLYGVKLARVEKNAGLGTVRAFARVEADETRVYHVNFGTEGFVRQTHDDAIGNHVAKNQHLADVYSPDFLAVAGGFLAANERTPGTVNLPRDNVAATAAQGAASVQARADRLRNLGMSDSQIEEITKSRQLPEDVYVVSPTDGFILSRNISPGMRFEREVDLYTIADLSHIWIVAEVFGKDAAAFRPGAIAHVTLPDTNEEFRATVSQVLPEVDPTTRTLKVRLEADNPGFKLRPNMFVSVEVPISLPPGLTVPSDAILDSGLSKRVYVQTSEGRFEARTVETGWEINDRVQIVKGLNPGETIVSSGTFMVDSESRLQMAGNSDNPVADVASADSRMQHHMN